MWVYVCGSNINANFECLIMKLPSVMATWIYTTAGQYKEKNRGPAASLTLLGIEKVKPSPKAFWIHDLNTPYRFNETLDYD